MSARGVSGARARVHAMFPLTDLAECELDVRQQVQAALLDAVLAFGGRWKSGRAVTALRGLGFYPVSPGTASADLRALAAAGHLVMHEKPGVRWYEAKAGGRP